MSLSFGRGMKRGRMTFWSDSQDLKGDLHTRKYGIDILLLPFFYVL